MTTVSSAPLTQQMLSSMLADAKPSVEDILRYLANSMTPALDSLINQLVPLKPTGSYSAANTATSPNTALSGAAIEAVVLKSTALLQPKAGATNQNVGLQTGGEQQFKVTVATDRQNFELTTKVPLPAGTKLLLNIGQNNLATVVQVSNPSASSELAAGVKPSQPTTGTLSPSGATGRSTTTQTALEKPAIRGQSTTQQTALFNRATIDQGLREAMPQQQPLRDLLPLLRTILQQPPQQIPRELLQQLHVLLQQFPSSQALQQPAQLKQVLQNNGVFLEAKLARELANTRAQGNTQPPHPNKTTANTQAASGPAGQTLPGTATTTSPLNLDIKALLQRLLPVIEKGLADPKAQPTSPQPQTALSNPNPAALARFITSADGDVDHQKPATALAQALPELLTHKAPLAMATQTTGKDQNVDIVLRQLGQQLLASLARTQMNQLESLAGRQANHPDGQGPLNSWTLEIPIMHGRNIDNLELRIEQELLDQEQQERKKSNQQQWTVMLAFDLHSLGKMNVQLKIVDKTVSATVWSQLEHTHLAVKREVRDFRQSLEKVGVTVKQVDCQLGLPPPPTSPIYKQLVDIRT